MKFILKSDVRGRLRVTCLSCGGRLLKRFTDEEASGIIGCLERVPKIKSIKVYSATAGIAVQYLDAGIAATRVDIIHALADIDMESVKFIKLAKAKKPTLQLKKEYMGRLLNLTQSYFIRKIFLPPPVRMVLNVYKAWRFFRKGLATLAERKLDVSVLDASAISASLLRKDYSTAGTVMYLLQVGEILEEWTYKKSVNDLAESMSLNIAQVWLVQGEQEREVNIDEIKKDDLVAVKMGTVIPLDGIVVSGDAMVNQASMTGESLPVHKGAGVTVYAGTVVEEGSIILRVINRVGQTRFERILSMIENSEKIKSKIESKADHLADRLVPYTLLGTLFTYAVTRNITKAMSILMVDFSCALKLSTPLTVLSAMRECSNHKITVKGGKFLEAVCEAKTIVFDKTGTLTKAEPSVAKIINVSSYSNQELLRYAACLEEHFPHSMANAIVRKAAERGLVHDEMHTKVEYVVAHGIVSHVNGVRIVIGSRHFVLGDEKCKIPRKALKIYNKLPDEYSHIYMAIGGILVGIICIYDPLRPEAETVLHRLRQVGFDKLVMMTGDNKKTAASVAAKLGFDEYYAEVLPEDKAAFINKEKAVGRRVVMVGDGINDSPALSEADVGIAIAEGADIAREVADITIGAQDLEQLVILKQISLALINRINHNFNFVIGFNSSLIIFGLFGIMSPAFTALLHNLSTLGVGLHSMNNLLPEN